MVRPGPHARSPMDAAVDFSRRHRPVSFSHRGRGSWNHFHFIPSNSESIYGVLIIFRRPIFRPDPASLKLSAEEFAPDIFPRIHPEKPVFMHVMGRGEQDSLARKPVEMVRCIIDQEIRMDHAFIAAKDDVTVGEKRQVFFDPFVFFRE